MDTAYTTRRVRCTCLGDTFERTLDSDLKPIWRCYNCGKETPRQRRSRSTNHFRALHARKALAEMWKPVDERLRLLVDAGLPSGALLVHASAFNYHMKQLLDLEQPTNFDVRYHKAGALDDLAKATAFVEEKERS